MSINYPLLSLLSLLILKYGFAVFFICHSEIFYILYISQKRLLNLITYFEIFYRLRLY